MYPENFYFKNDRYSIMKSYSEFIAEMGDPVENERMYAMALHKQVDRIWKWMVDANLMEDERYNKVVELMHNLLKETQYISNIAIRTEVA
jgi:hypothetical protein